MASTSSLGALRRLQQFPAKPRVFILSDISNEPDDAESLVRYLLYSNQFSTEGLVAVTSTWMRDKVCPQDMHAIIDGYAQVVDNLNQHTHPDFPYPPVRHWRSIIKPGADVYGFQAVGEEKPLSEGGQLLLDRITASSDKPLWILLWGGANTLAQTLVKIHSNFSKEEAAAFRTNLRIYAISDQDDTGAWIRATWPDIFYVVSVHAWNQYSRATWTGISGEKFYGFDDGGPDFSKMTHDWIEKNIQVGSLGSMYPKYLFIPEGDTPTFLYLIQNGLGVPEHPEYGSWGGRYQLVTDRSVSQHYCDTVDVVRGQDGRIHTSAQASIWRWRDTFQDDFAARMRWTLSPEFSFANYHPVISVNGSAGPEPLQLEVEAGGSVTLDARDTYDPDGDGVSFHWWHYREPSASQWPPLIEVAKLLIEPQDAESRVVKVTLPGPERCCLGLLDRKASERGQLLHLILEVTDSGQPRLTSYKRIMIQATNKELRGEAEAASLQFQPEDFFDV